MQTTRVIPVQPNNAVESDAPQYGIPTRADDRTPRSTEPSRAVHFRRWASQSNE
jgi:hypothetical protein